MTAISQTIPSYALGISQQPDEMKLPGQLNDALNVVPDITDGLYKRPGTRHITTFQNLVTEAKWFNYFRDQDEGAYIGRVNRNGNVRVWRADDGVEMTINTTGSPSTYLAHTSDTDIKTVTINDTTFISNCDKNNSSTAVKMDLTPVSPSKPHANSVYVELKTVAPRRTYGLNIYDDDTVAQEFTARTVEVVSPFNNNTDSNQDCRYTGYVTRVDPSTGVAVRVTNLGVPFATGLNGDEVTYDAQYTQQVELLNGGSYYSTKHNGSTVFNVNIEGVNFGIKVTGENVGFTRGNIQRIRPIPTDIETQTALSTSAVLNTIQSSITASGFTAQIIGNGIYIRRSGGSPFNVEALDGDLFNVVKDEVNNVSDLPTACKHGYIVRVVNSQDTVVDDYYLKFFGENGRDGEGHWEECLKPGQKYQFDADTMPHILQRTGPTTMSLGPWEWADKEVGDEFTNRNPSFVSILAGTGYPAEDRRINKVLFHRNRLVMLSGSNIVLSQPDNLNNFWNKTALTFSGKDRIDISSSSSSPNELVEGIEMNTGLVLFSSTAQYLFATDSDILNPETAKIYSLSNHNYDVFSSPFSLGTTIGFTSTIGRYSRFFEMNDIRTAGEPQIIDQSKVIPRLLPQFVDTIGNAKENTHLFFAKKFTKDVYGFKFFNAGDKRIQGAWFRWQFPKNISHQYVLNNRYYVVDVDGNLSYLTLSESLYSSLRVVNSHNVTEREEEFIVNLDNHSQVTVSNMTYNSTTDTTSFAYPSRLTPGKAVAIVTESINTFNTGSNRGRYEVLAGTNGQTATLDGNWTGSPLWVGDQIEMHVDLPTIYPTSTKGTRVVSDTNASLVLHRVKFSFGDIGQYQIKLLRKGKAELLETFESGLYDDYQANRAPYLAGSTRTMPLYEKNTNIDIRLRSEHPSPAVLHSLTWEGDYTNKYYKRI